jgi:flagellar hook assembly protein FlgD
MIIREIAKSDMQAGLHSFAWDGSGIDGKQVAAGLYLCRLSAGGKIMTRGMVFSK